MVAERRKPLVLSSTKALVDSLVGGASRVQRRDDGIPIDPALSAEDSKSSVLQLKAGILRMSENGKDVSRSDTSKIASLDGSALVGLSISTLKRLSITSGSLVLVKNANGNAPRVGQVLALDAPYRDENVPVNEDLSSHCLGAMLLFPSYDYSRNSSVKLDPEVAYLSPFLFFNLHLHTSCLKAVVHRGKDTLSSWLGFQVEGDANSNGNEKSSSVSVTLEPLTSFPKYATHVRVAFVRIPECSTLESFKRSPYVDDVDRQELIDLELNNYFTVDRLLSRGDLFSISIKWHCKSALCISCNQKMRNGSNDDIYFKVVAMEPSEEPNLRVNRTQTALVLGGNVTSAVLPAILVCGPNISVPIQQNVVKLLGSILAPPLCPSALSSKFRVAVLLHGLRGCGKRTVVKYIARQLGLHVVEYSCHNLLASSERKTSATLAQAFNAAHRYSPTIFLLRHFDVFRDLAHEGLPHEQLGVNSEVAAVIKEFTEPVIEIEDDKSDAIVDCYNVRSYFCAISVPSLLLLIFFRDSHQLVKFLN